MKPIVTIIIPNFNKQEYLAECINSVIDQSFIEWNLIIIDDNSTDNSILFLSKLEKNEKIKLIKLKKNKGPSFCRNLGMRLSATKYVAFLDSDDYWDKDKLKDQIYFMTKEKFQITFSDYYIFRENKKQNIINSTNVPSSFGLNTFIKNSSINTSTLIIEKSIIGNTKFKKIPLLEDYIFKCDLFRKGLIAYKLNKSNTAYRLTNKTRSSNKIKNLFILWCVNKKYNNLSFFKNLLSVICISLNSFKKYGFKK
jgi:teichuronic acid biosynthesis glycosyltransferase TuaG|tara:strand:- start:129 stop:887 length:759 start_codon:yes stop_codon:yes gene_type:complete